MNERTHTRAMAMAQPSTVQSMPDFNEDYFSNYCDYLDRVDATKRTYIYNLRHFVEWLQDHQITQPQRADVIAWRDELMKVRHLKNTSVKAYLQSVRLFFQWTEMNGYYPDITKYVHAPKVDIREHRKDYLRNNEVRDITQSIIKNNEQHIADASTHAKDQTGRTERATAQGKRLYAMFLLAINCGLRTIEISRANVEDVYLRNGNAYIVVQGKGHTGKDTTKAMAIEVYNAIHDYLQTRTNVHGSEPLFVVTGNRSKDGGRMTTRSISQILKDAMKENGYDSTRLTAHSLRHTTGQSVMELTENNIYLTQSYMDHTSPSTTEIYLHARMAEQKADLAERQYKYVFGESEAQ